MVNLLGNYFFLLGVMPAVSNYEKIHSVKIEEASPYTLKETDFLNAYMPMCDTLAKQYSGLSCFYLVEKSYFNVFNRDRLVHDFLFNFFYSIEKVLG
jgi:hypothetical protein